MTDAQRRTRMTTIDFYTRVDDRLAVAARLVAKAVAAHGSARVLTPDEATTNALDRLLWMVPATGFLPHCRVGSPLAAQTPVWIDHRLEHAGPAAVLVNLHAEPPPFFSRFERLAEIVGVDDAAAGRERYRFYRERGYELRAHDMSERG
ncbi:MAG: DNA polymerase III subunit chi [Burkholderiales bacterium]